MTTYSFVTNSRADVSEDKYPITVCRGYSIYIQSHKQYNDPMTH